MELKAKCVISSLLRYTLEVACGPLFFSLFLSPLLTSYQSGLVLQITYSVVAWFDYSTTSSYVFFLSYSGQTEAIATSHTVSVNTVCLPAWDT